MSLAVCLDCRAEYAPDLSACPHCGSDLFRFAWEEEDMPKATVEGGPSGHDEMTPAEAAAELTRLTEDDEPEQKPKPAPKPKVATVKAAADK